MSKIDRVKKDFEDAFDRLKRGAPNNISLKEKNRLGKLRISISSVAIEANHSRTLIGTSDCKYLDVRIKILNSKPEKSKKGISIQELAIKRSREFRELKAENLRIVSHNAALIIALEERDKALYLLKRAAPKSTEQPEIAPLVGGNVHRLRPKRNLPDRSGPR